MKVVIMCGISGSGKSTYIRNNFPDAQVCSADHFFMKDGKYCFDGAKLSMAHGECLRKFVSLVSSKEELVVVDNTNTSVMEISPYASLALAYGYELEIVIINADVKKAYGRNSHGVPLVAVKGQHSRLMKLANSLPPWWSTRWVNYEG